MNTDWQTLAWLGFGLALALSEFVVPGLVVLFLGLGAITVALGRLLGLITTPAAAIFTWIFSSVAYALALRNWLMRLFPPDTSYTPHRPDLEAVGEEVDVVETVRGTDANGRIRFQGTTWQARSVGADIPAGGRARLVTRQELVWLVSPVEPPAP